MRSFAFERVEKTYLLTKEQYIQLLDQIQLYIKPNQYYQSTICNLYYDTWDYQMARNVRDNTTYNEKIRLRSYGIPTEDTNVFLEIKRKNKEVISIRKIKMTLEDMDVYLNTTNWYNKETQMMKEVKYYFEHYHLYPTMYIACERIAYCGKEQKDLRITFDTNLRSRDYDLQLEKGDYGYPYFKDNSYIMEVKILGAMPLWLVNILSQLQIYPCSFSKYGNIYRKRILERRERNV